MFVSTGEWILSLAKDHFTEVLRAVEIWGGGCAGIPGQVVGAGGQISAFIAVCLHDSTGCQLEVREEQPYKGQGDFVKDLPAVSGAVTMKIK